VNCYIWYSEEGPGRAAAYQRPEYQVHIFDIALLVPVPIKGLTIVDLTQCRHYYVGTARSWLSNVIIMRSPPLQFFGPSVYTVELVTQERKDKSFKFGGLVSHEKCI